MQITERHITITIALVGWIAFAIWTVAGTKSDVAALKEDVTRMEDKIDQIMWWMQGNIGPTPPASAK